jgi:molybdopterin converting factor small subunit
MSNATVRIPTPLRPLAGGAGEVEVQGTTVGEAIGALEIAATSRYRTIATVLTDTGERYGSTGMWADVFRERPSAAREPA